MRAALKHPAIHFLVAGAAIFGLTRWLAPSPSGAPERYRIVVTAEQIDDLRARHRGRHGQPPTEEETTALIEATAIDEMLYREAITRHLDATDAVVERRLVQDMRFLTEQRDSADAVLLRQAHALGLQDGDPVIRRRLIQRMRSLLAQENAGEPPTDEEVRSHFENNRAAFTAAPTVRLTQIFFAGPDGPDKAASVLAELRATQAGPQAAAAFGDPFVGGVSLPMSSERGLAKIFGTELAHACLSLPVGEWSGPLRSAHGAHLLWIEERAPGQSPRLETVGENVRRRLEADRAEAGVRRGIAELRKRYRVELGNPPS